MSGIEERYAQALLSLTIEKEAASAAEAAIQQVVEAYKKNAEFKEFLRNPLIAPKRKHELIKGIFTDLPEVVEKFLMLLVDKFRIDIIPGIFRQYVELRDERDNVKKMQIFSTIELGPEKINDIRDKFSKMFNVSDFRVIAKVDPGLVGGIKVIVGDKVFDSSLRTRFGALKNAITEKLQAAKIN